MSPREYALSQAVIALAGLTTDAETIVKTADAFHAFLIGPSRPARAAQPDAVSPE